MRTVLSSGGGHSSRNRASQRWHQPRCHKVCWSQGLGPSGPASAQMLRAASSVSWLKNLCPVGDVKGNGTWQNTEVMDVVVWMVFWLLSQNGLVTAMGKYLFIHS